tara:strand:+ start:3684 stop:5261 length:1578 start_codon:yes stop_codon:yes gene_type:complete
MNKSEKVEDPSTEVSKLKNLEKTYENSDSPISNEENTNKHNTSDKDFSLLSPKSKIKKKKEIISKLRVLVDGNEDKDTLNKVKSLQDLWKQIGQLQDSKDRSLWSTYNALLDRFYDNRSIYFELKELDRKKNLEKKLIICDKAESLVTEKNIMKSVSQLNNLHSEFKHIGPVSKDYQNDIWERLKAASDLIYERKKEFILSIKDSLQENLVRKKGLIRKLDSFKDFNFSTIKDWSQKTKEIISLKDEWDSIGGVPNSDSKSINKDFWNIFKTFFQKKNKFFKKIDDSYKKNLQLKKDLIKKVETVMDSEEWDKTSTLIQSFQKDWKKIGKVPIKFKDSIYNEFKKSCDHFYNRKRFGDKDTIKLYQDNLKLKTSICDEIIKLSKNDSIDQDEFFKLQVKYLEVGHIPKENIDDLKQKFKKAIDSVVISSEKKLTKDEFDKFKFIIELNSLAKNPYSKNKIIKKKSDLIKKIHTIESEIKNLKNNIYYLKESVAADNLKKEYMSKIDQSDKEIESLKLQLNLINKV